MLIRMQAEGCHLFAVFGLRPCKIGRLKSFVTVNAAIIGRGAVGDPVRSKRTIKTVNRHCESSTRASTVRRKWTRWFIIDATDEVPATRRL